MRMFRKLGFALLISTLAAAPLAADPPGGGGRGGGGRDHGDGGRHGGSMIEIKPASRADRDHDRGRDHDRDHDRDRVHRDRDWRDNSDWSHQPRRHDGDRRDEWDHTRFPPYMRVDHDGLDREDLEYRRDCPPGLAKKSPACVPPGQAHRYLRRGEILRDGDHVLIPDPRRYRLEPRSDWRYYRDGDYIYRVDSRTGRVLTVMRLMNVTR